MHDNYLSSIAAVQASLEKMNTVLSDACKPSISATQSFLEFQQQIRTIAFPRLNLAVQMRAQLDALTTPARQMQEMWNASLVSSIRDTLAINDSVIQNLTRNIQRSLMDFSSLFSVDFSSTLQNISFYNDYIEMPEKLYASLINEEGYECDVPLATAGSLPKRRITLEFFLSCILPNIIALFGVWLTIYFHNIDSSADAMSSQAETVQFEKYTETLENLNLSVSALIDYLNAQSKSQQGIHSVVATDSNSVLEVLESDSEAADESDNPDTPRQPD